jgi:hypothetical protein
MSRGNGLVYVLIYVGYFVSLFVKWYIKKDFKIAIWKGVINEWKTKFGYKIR